MDFFSESILKYLDLDIRNVSIVYNSKESKKITLIFQKTYLSFIFSLEYDNVCVEKNDIMMFNDAIKENYKLSEKETDSLISIMEIEILKEKNKRLEEKSKREENDKWLEKFKNYGFVNLEIEKLADMKIKYDPVGIYILRDLDNGKRYVGQGKKVITRILEHFTNKADDEVSRAYRSGHKFEVENIITGYKDGSDFCLNKVEAEVIDYYNTVENGYNVIQGNRKGVGYKGANLLKNRV